jgi:phosphonate transport system ATP-binding protein
MFVLRDVGKSYGRTQALAPLSLEIAHGERVALLGPSGSGKTTLLHLLGGVIRPSEGAVLVAGQPLARLNPGRELASLVGTIHQQLDLVPHLAVVHNVMAGRLGQWNLLRSLVSLVSPRERRLAEEALERVGILDKLYERTSRLSGGEQQRVAVARLLVQSPRAFLADEPVASLDPARADDLMRLLVQIVDEDGRTLVASLHNVQHAKAYFTRAIGLRNGQVAFDAPVASLSEERLARLYDLSGARESREYAGNAAFD